MPYYRLCFAKDARAGCFDEFQAADDPAALGEALQHLDQAHADLWCGDRLVGRLAGDGPAAGTEAASRPAEPHRPRPTPAW